MACRSQSSQLRPTWPVGLNLASSRTIVQTNNHTEVINMKRNIRYHNVQRVGGMYMTTIHDTDMKCEADDVYCAGCKACVCRHCQHHTDIVHDPVYDDRGYKLT